uniref:Uncharacterized protein n=1 Tax=Ixodes ricinus TaxID=34613 RepID=A0A6B0U7B4_IXORI
MHSAVCLPFFHLHEQALGQCPELDGAEEEEDGDDPELEVDSRADDDGTSVACSRQQRKNHHWGVILENVTCGLSSPGRLRTSRRPACSAAFLLRTPSPPGN